MHGKNIAQIFLTLIREICIAGYYPGYVFFIFISFYMCISVDRFIFFTATLWHLNAGISWSVGMVDVTTSGLFSFVFFLFSCSKMFVCDLFFFLSALQIVIFLLLFWRSVLCFYLDYLCCISFTGCLQVQGVRMPALWSAFGRFSPGTISVPAPRLHED